MRFRDTPPDDNDPSELFQPPRPAPAMHIVAGPEPDIEALAESPPRKVRWLVAAPDTPDTADTDGSLSRWDRAWHRLPGRAWAALAATVAILGGAVALSATNSEQTGDAAAPPSASSTAEGACTGLSGTVVTDRDGDPTTVPGLIASFEAAYYIHRNPEAALRLIAPEAGIAAEGLAVGIASIPAGTTHCVAITPISATTANVHIAELHPDRKRLDYLQLINTRPADTGAALLISNFQKQG
ncbi:hypothetical protein ACFWPK_08965 [Nocardia sp. NPDC058519]|uniref:hypothetical protein n=1 Tax=Nocardia sp. NPDC058519 TaxID=3346535 RepID=UPI00365D2209